MSEAMKLLEEAIEVARKEAFAEGYAAAIQAMREFVAKASSPSGETRAARSVTGQTGSRRIPSGEGDYVPVERGTNALLVESALQTVSPRAIGPTEIQHIVARDAGKKIAYSSVRHALDQLKARDVAREASAKRWRYISENERTGASNQEPEASGDSISCRAGDGDPGENSPGSLDLAAE
jgi:uncharacterized membrane protein YqiK